MSADEIRLGADFTKVESEAKEASRAIEQIGDSAGKARDFLDEVEADYAASMAEVSKSTDKATKSTEDLGKGVHGVGGLMESLAEGGVANLSTNLKGLAESLAGPAGITLGLAALTLAFEYLKEPVGNFISGLVDGANKVPPLADALGNLKERLGDVEGQLKSLREKQTLTNAELSTYNRLVGEQAEAEKAVNVERERRKAIDEEAAGKPAAGAKDAAQKAIDAGGGFDAVSDEVRNLMDAADPEIAKLRSKIIDLNKVLTEGFKNVPGFSGEATTSQIDAAQRRIDGLAGRNSTSANELVAKARQGDTAAIGRLADLLPGGGFTDATPAGLAGAKETQEAIKREDEYNKQRAKEAEDGAKQRLKDDEKAEAERQKAAMLRTNNAYAQREQDAKQAEKDGEKADRERSRRDARSARTLERGMRTPLPRDPVVDQMIANQQMMADQMNQQMAWRQQQMQAAQFVPSLLQWGGM